MAYFPIRKSRARSFSDTDAFFSREYEAHRVILQEASVTRCKLSESAAPTRINYIGRIFWENGPSKRKRYKL